MSKPLSHMIPHVTAETSEEFEGHEKFQIHGVKTVSSTSWFIQHLCRTAVPSQSHFFHKPPAVAPIAVPQPWGLRRRTCCLPGRPLSRSCWRERRRQGPAELARHTWQFWQWNGGELWRDFTAAVLNYPHGQLAVHVAGTTGIVRHQLTSISLSQL